MKRQLGCEVLGDTWPKKKAPKKIRQAFVGTKEVDIFEFLLTVGYSTVPAHAARHSINALWAWVRYFGALSTKEDFELNFDFSELDPHQKTILSDDFGMGMSIHLLADALGLISFCDGKYFIDRLAPRLGFTTNSTSAKRSPNKSPDFVAIDRKGRFHVIECKGSQSGRGYVLRQLKDAIPQKNSIAISKPLKGESLATGFVISQHGKDWTSRFIIADPEPEDPVIEVFGDRDVSARETIQRGKIARTMTLAGATNLSRLIAAPYADNPRNLRDTISSKSANDNAERLREQSQHDIERLTKFDDGFLGREATLDLPFTVDTGKASFTKISLRSGINADVVSSWTDSLMTGNGLDRDDFLSEEEEYAASGALKTQADETSGILQDGNLFVSEARLQK